MKKNDYQNLMEHIQPPAGLNDRVLSAARQTAGAQKETTGPKHLAPGKRRPVLRAAVCAACALALVVGSVTLGPIGGGEPGESGAPVTALPSFSFGLTAYAADIGETIVPNANGGLALRSGTGIWDPLQGYFTGCLFQVTGENLQKVTLSVDRGGLYRSETRKALSNDEVQALWQAEENGELVCSVYGADEGETEGRNMQQITPDFIIDTNDDGTITFSLNRGNIPQLTVSPSFTDMIDTYRKHKDKMSRSDKEALLYAKEKVDKAQGFIEAIKQRRHTLIVTMKAIIDIQRQFFLDGDEADLKPMILKDVAERTGLDISTISRVSNVKYAQTKWGTFPLKFFFTDSYTTEDGEEMSTRKIKIALHDIIEKEDKKKPISDDALAKLLKEKGFPIARRTVAKYREQLGIPVARLRK